MGFVFIGDSAADDNGNMDNPWALSAIQLFVVGEGSPIIWGALAPPNAA